ncbi:MAG: aspartate dehydrogenase [Azospirillaceae bacterium]
MQSIGIIGYGGIARTAIDLVRRCEAGRIAGLLLRPGREATAAESGLPVFTDMVDLIVERPSVVAECAGQEAVRAYGPAVLAAGIDLIVISIGALADARIEAALSNAAQRGGGQLLLPSGAIGGIDALAAMRFGGLSSVAYRSRKPPAAWAGSPAEDAVDLKALSEATVFYRGTAREAALAYPKNANVAATVALAGLGLDQTEVEMIADPKVRGNVHEIVAEGASGRFTIQLEGRPSPDNPRTSALTALSVARALINRDAAIQI